MAKTSTYLNFVRNTEEAFNFYKSVFGTEFTSDGVLRMGDFPNPQLKEEDKNLIMHIELPILGDHILMGCDAPESMGFTLNVGNNTHIMLQPDSREEADRLFAGLSVNGKVTMPLQDVMWNAYYGSFTDQFGIQWMINCPNQ